MIVDRAGFEPLKIDPYLAKPFEHPEVIRVVRAALAKRERRRRFHTEEISADNCLRVMMGPSDAVTRIIREVNRVAQSDFSVIVRGETGSGKELVARSGLHGLVRLPHDPQECQSLYHEYADFLRLRDETIRERIANRTLDEEIQEKIYLALIPLLGSQQ